MEDLKQRFLEKVQNYGCKNDSLAVNYFTRLNAELPKSFPVKTWQNINFDDFLSKSIAYANIGIDPLAPKTLSFTLFANKFTGKTDVVFIQDVKCMEIIARRYGVNCPVNITVELIYSTDKFALVKKDLTNPSDGYALSVTNAFERGEIIGGVSLSEYENPIYNKVRLMSLKEIEKRVRTTDSKGAATSFWRDFKPEMCEKTIGKNAWSKVALDTTDLAEFYSATIQENIPEEYIPESTDDLPFDPDNEL
jgi:recombination protein RecT